MPQTHLVPPLKPSDRFPTLAMATIYWFALVVGGGMLGASFFGDLFESGSGDGSGASDAAKFLSLRYLTYFLFAFGATGVVTDWLGLLPAGLTVGAAVVIGAIATVAAASVLDYVQRTESGEREEEESFVGCTGRVTLPFGADHAGRVIIQRGPREYELRARSLEPRTVDPAIGAGIMIVEMDDGTALVVPLEESLPASGGDA